MSYQGNLLAEQEADEFLMSLGESERRELTGEKKRRKNES